MSSHKQVVRTVRRHLAESFMTTLAEADGDEIDAHASAEYPTV